MKRIFILVAVCAGLLVVSAPAQSLGDIARQNRAKKKPSQGTKTVIDNDTIPSAVIPPEAPAKEKTEGAEAEAGKPESKSKAEAPKDASKDVEAWKSKIESQKKEITQLQREIDVAEREAKMNAAAYYADAGARLRDEAKFNQESRDRMTEIDTKKQALEAAKQKLSDLQEQARKAGVPSGQLD